MNGKDFKDSLRDEKRPGICFYGQGVEKPCPLMFAKKESMLLCKKCIEYWYYTSYTSTYISIFTVCKFRDVLSEKLLGLPT